MYKMMIHVYSCIEKTIVFFAFKLEFQCERIKMCGFYLLNIEVRYIVTIVETRRNNCTDPSEIHW